MIWIKGDMKFYTEFVSSKSLLISNREHLLDIWLSSILFISHQVALEFDPLLPHIYYVYI